MSFELEYRCDHCSFNIGISNIPSVRFTIVDPRNGQKRPGISYGFFIDSLYKTKYKFTGPLTFCGDLFCKKNDQFYTIKKENYQEGETFLCPDCSETLIDIEELVKHVYRNVCPKCGQHGLSMWTNDFL